MSLWPFGLYIVLVVALVAAMLAISFVLGQRHDDRATRSPYEAGIVSEGRAKWIRQHLKDCGPFRSLTRDLWRSTP